MVILKAANMFAGTTSQKGFLLKGFKCTVYRFSAKLKLKVMCLAGNIFLHYAGTIR